LIHKFSASKPTALVVGGIAASIKKNIKRKKRPSSKRKQ